MREPNRTPSWGLIYQAGQLEIEHSPHISAPELKRLVREKMLTAPPYQALLDEAKELGVRIVLGMTAATLYEAIRATKRRLSQQALRDNPLVHEGAVIWHEGVLVYVISIDRSNFMVRLECVVPRRKRNKYSCPAYELRDAVNPSPEDIKSTLLHLRGH